MGAQRGLHRYTDGERMISQDIQRAPDAAPGELADALIRTLEIERSVLEELDSDFQLQREAISRRDFETIEDATHRTNESVTRLDTLRMTRQRQTRLDRKSTRLNSSHVAIS